MTDLVLKVYRVTWRSHSATMVAYSAEGACQSAVRLWKVPYQETGTIFTVFLREYKETKNE